MKVKKFTLDKDNKLIRYNHSPDSFTNDLYHPSEATTISIYLIEIKTPQNPSNIIFQLRSKGVTNSIPLSIYKTELHFINDLYCWSILNKEVFTFNPYDFTVEIEGDIDDFIIDFYYSTDQKRPYILFEAGYYR